MVSGLGVSPGDRASESTWGPNTGGASMSSGSRLFRATAAERSLKSTGPVLTAAGLAEYKYFVVNKMARLHCCCCRGSQSP
jgi:hypothetical protein